MKQTEFYLISKSPLQTFFNELLNDGTTANTINELKAETPFLSDEMKKTLNEV